MSRLYQIHVDTTSQTVAWLSESGTDADLRDLKRAAPVVNLELVALLPCLNEGHVQADF